MQDVSLDTLPDGSLLARIGGEGWKFGDPYEIMVVVVPLDEETVKIAGLDKRPNVEQWRKLEEALLARGFCYMEFDRIKNGVVRHKTKALRARVN
jgi:hypothetical protein